MFIITAFLKQALDEWIMYAS